jgi:hypothetical protein
LSGKRAQGQQHPDGKRADAAESSVPNNAFSHHMSPYSLSISSHLVSRVSVLYRERKEQRMICNEM